MADMTPEEIQQARARAGGIVRLQDQCCANEEFLARAVLALTEQVEKLDDEALKWTEIAGRHAEEVEALTEQQPEPVAPPLNEDPVAVALGLAEPLNAEIAARAEAIKKRVAILRLERELREQPEPVSRREIFNLISSATDEAQNYITDELLSRYTITRKQPEGDHHG